MTTFPLKLNMGHRIYLKSKVVIAAYNADAKENKLIAIFSSITIAAEYFFEFIPIRLAAGRVRNAVNHNTRLYEHQFGFPIALRYAKPEYVEMLSDNQFLIMAGYPKGREIERVKINCGQFEKCGKCFKSNPKTKWIADLS